MTDMTELTTSDDHAPRQAGAGLRRVAVLTAFVAFGLLAPTAVGAAPAQAAQPPGPGDLTADPGCEPDLPCGDDPEPECDPDTEICDFVSGGNGPDDPCEGENPPESCDPDPGVEDDPDDPTDEPSGDPGVDGAVDVAVRATPNFTG